MLEDMYIGPVKFKELMPEIQQFLKEAIKEGVKEALEEHPFPQPVYPSCPQPAWYGPAPSWMRDVYCSEMPLMSSSSGLTGTTMDSSEMDTYEKVKRGII